MRLDTTASILLYSSDPVSDIAYRIGYDTPAAFTLEFYLNDPDRTKPENLKTDIYVPVKKV